jgi:hypothetical protein
VPGEDGRQAFDRRRLLLAEIRPHAIVIEWPEPGGVARGEELKRLCVVQARRLLVLTQGCRRRKGSLASLLARLMHLDAQSLIGHQQLASPCLVLRIPEPLRPPDFFPP